MGAFTDNGGKPVTETMETNKNQINEDQINESVIANVMMGMGIGAGIDIYNFVSSLVLVLAAGGVLGGVVLKNKIKDYIKKIKTDKSAKEAYKWIKTSDTYKLLLSKMKELDNTKDKKDIAKQLNKERMTIKRKLKSEVGKANISDKAKSFIYDMVPGLKSTRANESVKSSSKEDKEIKTFMRKYFDKGFDKMSKMSK